MEGKDMKKKILLFILLLLPISIKAKTTFLLDEVTASPGSNVTINYKMDNKEEFGVLTSRIKYDYSKLEYVDSELKGLKKGSFKGIENNEEKGIVAVYSINLGDAKMNDTGTIATIEFKVKDDVTEDIPLTLEIIDFGIDEDTPIEYDIINGVIHTNNNTTTKSKNTKESLVEEFKKEVEEKDINEEEIMWSSSDESVATVDENGEVVFKKDGNVKIEAKDKDGNVIYSKEYFVKDDVKNSNNNLLIPCIIGGVILLLVIIIIWRIKCKRKKR